MKGLINKVLILAEFFIAIFTAIAMENILLTRALDTYGIYETIQSPKSILILGSIVTLITALSSIPIYYLNLVIKPLPNYSYIGAIIYIAVNGLVYLMVYFAIKFLFPKLHEELGKSLPFCGVNCATFGSILISSRMNDNNIFVKFLGYNIGTGIGFTLALFLIWGLRRKLLMNSTPKSFRGLPITLIYIGLLSLSIFGITGSPLPS